MNWPKRAIKTLGIISALAIATPLGSQVARGVTFTPPPEQGAPRQSEGGASRSGELCTANLADPKTASSSVTLLLPEGNYGRTLSARPTILVYVPETGAREALFSLKDKDKNTVYNTTVSLSQKEEIIAIEIPETAPALEVGETYKWFFAVNCEGSLRPLDPVEGWVERVDIGSEQLADEGTSNMLEAAASYGAAGIWYDAAATLADLRKSQPADEAIAKHWIELLGSVGLNELQTVSLADSL